MAWPLAWPLACPLAWPLAWPLATGLAFGLAFGLTKGLAPGRAPGLAPGLAPGPAPGLAWPALWPGLAWPGPSHQANSLLKNIQTDHGVPFPVSTGKPILSPGPDHAEMALPGLAWPGQDLSKSVHLTKFLVGFPFSDPHLGDGGTISVWEAYVSERCRMCLAYCLRYVKCWFVHVFMLTFHLCAHVLCMLMWLV